MTMHQAKGREFKVVFLTGDGAKQNSSSRRVALAVDRKHVVAVSAAIRRLFTYGVRVYTPKACSKIREKAYLRDHFHIPDVRKDTWAELLTPFKAPFKGYKG